MNQLIEAQAVNTPGKSSSWINKFQSINITKEVYNTNKELFYLIDTKRSYMIGACDVRGGLFY